jgi:hypothetical protein
MINLNPPPQEEEQWIKQKFDHDWIQAYHELGKYTHNTLPSSLLLTCYPPR